MQRRPTSQWKEVLKTRKAYLGRERTALNRISVLVTGPCPHVWHNNCTPFCSSGGMVSCSNFGWSMRNIEFTTPAHTKAIYADLPTSPQWNSHLILPHKHAHARGNTLRANSTKKSCGYAILHDIAPNPVSHIIPIASVRIEQTKKAALQPARCMKKVMRALPTTPPTCAMLGMQSG